MAIITKGAVNKNQVSIFQLNKGDLELIVEDPYFSDPTNWKRVRVCYTSSEGNQREVVVFDATEEVPTGEFLVSDKARDEFLVRKIVIEDFDGGSLDIFRDELNEAEFDVLFGVISGVISGAISLWGQNESGQLGSVSAVNQAGFAVSNTLVNPLVGFSDFKQLSMGSNFSVGLRSNGEIWAWGANLSGQLGDGTTVTKNSPVKMLALVDDFTQIAAFNGFVQAIKSDGTLWQTGLGSPFIGPGTGPNRSSMTQVTGHSNFKQLFGGPTSGAIFAIKSDNSVWSWGANSHGQLGNGNKDNVSLITSRPDLSGFVQFSTYQLSTLAVKSDGTLYATGYNFDGQLGLGNNADVSTFTQVVGHSNVKQVHCGASYTYILKSDGVLWSTGNGSAARTGLGSIVNTSNFTQITSTSDFKKITCNWGSAVGLKSDGTLWGVGNGFYGAMLGLGFSNRTSFSLLSAGTDNDDIAAGEFHFGLIKKST